MRSNARCDDVQGYSRSLQLTSTGPQTIKRAEGESVTLGCTYTPGSSDTGELDIEWSVVSPDTTKKDQLVSGFNAPVYVVRL